MTKKKDTKPIVEDPDLYARMKKHLYSKEPLLGEDSPFSELLQQMVDKMLDGEMDAFMSEERTTGKTNKPGRYDQQQNGRQDTE